MNEKVKEEEQENSNSEIGVDSEVGEPVPVDGDSELSVDTQGVEKTSSEDDDNNVSTSEDLMGNAQEIESVSDRLEVLIPNVLDTAEATNAAADVTAKAASSLELGLDRLHERADVLTEVSKRSTVLSTRILIGSITALILSAFIYGFMSYQLATRTSQIDGMLLAVGKRIVKMNSALATFEDINDSISKLAEQQNSFELAQASVLDAVARAEKTVKELQQIVPEKAAERVEKNTDKVAVQVNKLNEKVVENSVEAAKFNKTITELSRRMGAFEKRISDVRSLNLDVAALVKLQRERYLEALRKKNEVEEAQLQSELDKREVQDPSIIKYPKSAG